MSASDVSPQATEQRLRATEALLQKQMERAAALSQEKGALQQELEQLRHKLNEAEQLTTELLEGRQPAAASAAGGAGGAPRRDEAEWQEAVERVRHEEQEKTLRALGELRAAMEADKNRALKELRAQMEGEKQRALDELRRQLTTTTAPPANGTAPAAAPRVVPVGSGSAASGGQTASAPPPVSAATSPEAAEVDKLVSAGEHQTAFKVALTARPGDASLLLHACSKYDPAKWLTASPPPLQAVYVQAILKVVLQAPVTSDLGEAMLKAAWISNCASLLARAPLASPTAPRDQQYAFYHQLRDMTLQFRTQLQAKFGKGVSPQWSELQTAIDAAHIALNSCLMQLSP